MIKTFCLPMGHKEVISIQWFHTANNGMISQMTSSFSSKLLQTPPPSSKWWVISYYNTTNAFIGMHSLCLWGSGLILAATREDPFTLYGRRRRRKLQRWTNQAFSPSCHPFCIASNSFPQCIFKQMGRILIFFESLYLFPCLWISIRGKVWWFVGP